MHTIKLRVEDASYQHIITLLSSLSAKGVEILEDIPSKNEGVDFSSYKIDSFKCIDPLAWQQKIRDEWDRC